MSTSANRRQLATAIMLTLGMVVVVRESAWLVCRALGMESATNIVGLVVMFIGLMAWRRIRQARQGKALPDWLNTASGILLADSAFAFLPVSAGAGILLLNLGDELIGFTLTVIISTLIPLWAFAKLANHWLRS